MGVAADAFEARATLAENELLRRLTDDLEQACALFGRFKFVDEDRALFNSAQKLAARFRAQLEGREPRAESIVAHGLQTALAAKGVHISTDDLTWERGDA
jgi:hypothetical protein